MKSFSIHLTIILVTLLAISQNAYSSGVESDLVVIGEKIYWVNDFPFHKYQHIHPELPEFIGQTHNKPYEAKWEISDDKLWLIHFNSRNFRTRRPIKLNDLFPGRERVLADWFTGTVVLAESSKNNGRRGDISLAVTIENGVVLRTKELNTPYVRSPGRIGIKLEIVDGKVIVKTIDPEGTAAKSGAFEVGDQLVGMSSEEWGNKDFENKTIEQVTGYITGVHGTEVNIRKKNADGSIQEIKLVRFSNY